MKKGKVLVGLALMALMLSQPQAAALGVTRAMVRWQSTVAPAVFPFLALMPLITCGEAARLYDRALGRAMGALFGLPGQAAAPMVIGWLAGTPAGVLAARGVAARSGMDRGQLCRVAVAATGFSPAFLVSGIGERMLGSAALGWRLALTQLCVQLAMAFLLRRAWRDQTQAVSVAGPIASDGAVRGAVAAVLAIGGYMALFAALACAAGAWLGDGPGSALLCLMDAPSGAQVVSRLPIGIGAKLTLLSAMCGFGGACVIAQWRGAMKGCGPGLWACLALRLLAGLLGGLFMAAQLCLAGSVGAGAAQAVRAQPLAMAGLCAALLAIPALVKIGKSIS